jgi:hypothetical protein
MVLSHDLMGSIYIYMGFNWIVVIYIMGSGKMGLTGMEYG